MSEITPEMERMAALSLTLDVEDVTDAMIAAYEEVISIDPQWEPPEE